MVAVTLVQQNWNSTNNFTVNSTIFHIFHSHKFVKKILTQCTQISLCYNLLNTHNPTQARYSAIQYQNNFHRCPLDALVVALFVKPGNLKSLRAKRKCHILCDARKLVYFTKWEMFPSLICTVNGNINKNKKAKTSRKVFKRNHTLFDTRKIVIGRHKWAKLVHSHPSVTKRMFIHTFKSMSL